MVAFFLFEGKVMVWVAVRSNENAYEIEQCLPVRILAFLPRPAEDTAQESCVACTERTCAAYNGTTVTTLKE
jgi:hypothetical protein